MPGNDAFKDVKNMLAEAGAKQHSAQAADDTDPNRALDDAAGGTDTETDETNTQITDTGGNDELQGGADEGGEGDPDPDGDGTDETGGGEAGTGEAGDGTEDIRTIAQLAAAIEVEPEFLYDMEISMGDNAEPVKLGALKDLYTQLLKTSGEQTVQLEEQTGQLNQVNDMTQQGQGVSQAMMQAFSNMDAIQKQFETTDWAALETEDAGHAALLRQKFQEAFNEARGAAQKAQGEMQQYKQANMQRAGEIMLNIMPNWKDKEVRTAAQGEIRKMLRAEGATDAYIDQIADPVAMKLLNELVLLRGEKAAATKAVHKVHKAPKVLKAGGRFRGPNKLDVAAKLKKAARNAPASSRGKAEMAAVKALLAANTKH